MRGSPLSIPDSLIFRKMWRDGATFEAIAAVFNTDVQAVGNARKRYGYPDRLRGKLLGPMPRTPAHPQGTVRAVKPAARAQSGGFGRWDVAQIAAVQRTAGRYRSLAALADEWGESVNALVGLWHRVRVAG